MTYSDIRLILTIIPIMIAICFCINALFKKNSNNRSTITYILLIIISAFLYYFNANYFVIYFLITVLINTLAGRLIIHSTNDITRKNIYSLFVILDSVFLISVKYYSLDFGPAIIPLGVSFITFKEISYLTDLYKNSLHPQSPLTDISYLMMPSQIQSGPIIKYYEYAESNLYKNNYTHSGFINNITAGVTRLMTGVIKKVIIADTLSTFVNTAFNSDIEQLTTLWAWLGAVFYSLQLYYDFSGYSDMAIGITRILGFDCPENFDSPYASASVSEFWRRWHITLGSWFREYVYFPLGGSRCSKIKTFRNLFIVWMLTGLWHGFKLNFIIWAMIHFLFICFEHFTGILKTNNKQVKLLWRVITIFEIIITWVMFRADNAIYGLKYLKTMFTLTNESNTNYLNNISILLLTALSALTFSLPTTIIPNRIKRLISQNFYSTIIAGIIILLFTLSLAIYANRINNPFAYANF